MTRVHSNSGGVAWIQNAWRRFWTGFTSWIWPASQQRVSQLYTPPAEMPPPVPPPRSGPWESPWANGPTGAQITVVVVDYGIPLKRFTELITGHNRATAAIEGGMFQEFQGQRSGIWILEFVVLRLRPNLETYAVHQELRQRGLRAATLLELLTFLRESPKERGYAIAALGSVLREFRWDHGIPIVTAIKPKLSLVNGWRLWEGWWRYLAVRVETEWQLPAQRARS